MVLETGKMCTVKALLDSGCTTTCIDQDYAKAKNFELYELDVHIVTRNTDGMENTRGKITHYVEMIMTIGPHSEWQRFLVTRLGKAWIFIDYNWLFKHNPEVDWRSQRIVLSQCPPESNMKGNEFQTGVWKEEALEDDESILMVKFAE
jgi:hypothetical protein